MTLVLTQLSQNGIVMAADSAVTFQIPSPGGGLTPRVLHGARKLQPVPHIRAGISCWGIGSISGTHTDVWIEDFVRRSQTPTNDLHAFAQMLASELNSILPPNSPNSGFHIAGFLQSPNGLLPAFYHVHNGTSQYFPTVNPAIFNANFDVPPTTYPRGQFSITRNGDYRLYAEFFTHFLNFLNGIPSNPQFSGVQIPSLYDLYAEAKFLRLQIQTVAGLYDISNLVRGIGGPITVLGIGPNGFEFLETK